MTTVDVYDAWLTAGDWVLTYWPWLGATGVILAAAVTAVWAVGRDDYRSHNDRTQALMRAHLERPEPAAPGVDDDLLLDCRAAYGNCDELTALVNDIWKENRP